MTMEKFSKNYLDFNNPKGTGLIEITVTAKTPEQAQFIALEISSNLKNTLTTLGQKENSYLKNFFDEKLKEAQKNMELSESKLMAFSQSTKTFLPEGQAA